MSIIGSGIAYHTSGYLFVFLPLSLLCYQLAPRKWRWIALLSLSFLFYWMFSGRMIVYMIGTVLVTHFTCMRITKVREKERSCVRGKGITSSPTQDKKGEKRILTFGILAVVITLGILKYYGFAVSNWNLIAVGAAYLPILQPIEFCLPLGISFYTLQAVGYMVDVYWGKANTFSNPARTALFLCFFPQIMEGPICTCEQTAGKLWRGDPVCPENLSAGSIRILWGLFKKLVIADRLHVAVGAVFDHYENYHGAMIAFAAIAYTIQLYMEFSGCMDIVLGSGRMFGIELPENFRQPFFAVNAADFWQRWHISLGQWFRTYIFYPAAMSAPVKKWSRFTKRHFGKDALGKYLSKMGSMAIALFPVWLCNGLWHGPRWTYVFFGMYYYAILLVSAALDPLREYTLKKLHIRKETAWYRVFRIAVTWLIIFTGELFFRAENLSAGIKMFCSMFRGFSFAQIGSTCLKLGLDQADYMAVITGCMIVFAVGIIKEKKLPGNAGIQKLWLPIRWAAYYGLIFAVVILGAYGIGYQPVDLIYAGF